MSWVRLGRHRYYRRSVRAGGRVTSVYYGGGAEAELASALDRESQRRRRAEREALLRAREVWESASRPLDRLALLADLLASAALHAAGYHNHRGVWRRRGRIN